ncbi:bifunctional 5,10-methylenetetrahydrofolate dehydrogenase/5,10-methenyltetrahydrofolate cyclohydrolase [Halococcus saccharolyticus]|uniref:Bifunctional protein FolD n=1 Tax=Halococcus saccharolyticus DSM 5350 TaxID=1227455 RepID=M0MQ88_9EURY|nr:bifunctional 5,10-methylene-tetrahydrofolate dehydrogenase/5,10-methylene-tetrahydrofolate cyclohydrolase [Halococcus saccharolyticus]EMA47892.1 bifunctional 5,10-methylene-tetrahydrofolate dehydrogenase/ 5,10-methylene-tetrahydrofolate cyclohydrolase [Halococcus saccharolyticus DSM 5350]
MPSAERLRGEPVAAEIRADVRDRVHELGERGVTPTLATVVMSDDPADERFVELKHAACRDLDIASRDVRIDPDAPAERLHQAIDRLCADPAVDGVFVQVPLPDHVALAEVRQRLDPATDIDCLSFTNLGRLVRGDPRYLPATPAAVRRLLTTYEVPIEGEDVAIVGRSEIVGKPLTNLLLRDAPDGNATVTVCHSRTSNLGAVTRQADIVVTAAGVPGLVDGSMLSRGVTVVDVSANRIESGSEGKTQVVGDVDFESAAAVAEAITPVPGGVGPVTLAMLVSNVVLAAERRADAG